MKLFQIGLNKTGTTSLHAALEILGYKSIHNIRKEENILPQLKEGDTTLFDQYECFTDGTWHREFKYLKENYPDAKFVLMVRDKEEWIQSRINHVLSNRVNNSPPWREIDTVNWSKKYDEHYKEVREFFKDDPNFLEFNVCDGEGWEKLCPFLNNPIPDDDFPWENRTHKKNYNFTSDWFSRHIPTWRKHLSHLKDKPARALEIGCFEGRSSCWTLQNILTHKDSLLTCVDPWRNREAEVRFNYNIQESGHSIKVKKTRSESCKALRWMPLNHFDCIYIDGCHEGMNVLEDAILSFRLLKKGGIMIFDDYLWKGKHKILPQPAIDAFLSIYEHRLKVVHKEYQVIVERHI